MGNAILPYLTTCLCLNRPRCGPIRFSYLSLRPIIICGRICSQRHKVPSDLREHPVQMSKPQPIPWPTGLRSFFLGTSDQAIRLFLDHDFTDTYLWPSISLLHSPATNHHQVLISVPSKIVPRFICSFLLNVTTIIALYQLGTLRPGKSTHLLLYSKNAKAVKHKEAS